MEMERKKLKTSGGEAAAVNVIEISSDEEENRPVDDLVHTVNSDSESEQVSIKAHFEWFDLPDSSRVSFNKVDSIPASWLLHRALSGKGNDVLDDKKLAPRLQWGVSLDQIVNGDGFKSTHMLQINFMVDLDWFMQHSRVNMKNLRHLLVIHGFKENSEYEEMLKNQVQIWGKKLAPTNALNATSEIVDGSIELIRPNLPYTFGCHHTKAMVLLDLSDHKDIKGRVVVHTANLVHGDWQCKTQMVWQSPILRSKRGGNEGNGSAFEKTFIDDYFIGGYQKIGFAGSKSLILDWWIQKLRMLDFSPIKERLIVSIPGYHPLSSSHYGLTKFGSCIDEIAESQKEEDSPNVSKEYFLFQSSSLGNLTNGKGVYRSWFETDVAGRAYKTSKLKSASDRITRLIYPTLDEVKESFEGLDAGASLPHNRMNWRAHQNQIRPFLAHWKSNYLARNRAMPHVKSYCHLNVQEESNSSSAHVNWFLLTSANISKSAWGSNNSATKKREPSLFIRSYEMGVLIHIPKEEGETISLQSHLEDPIISGRKRWIFPIPYDFPPTDYKSSDEPWIWD